MNRKQEKVAPTYHICQFTGMPYINIGSNCSPHIIENKTRIQLLYACWEKDAAAKLALADWYEENGITQSEKHAGKAKS